MRGTRMAHSRFLHGTPGQVAFARNDKKERVVAKRGRLLNERPDAGGTAFPSTTTLSFGNRAIPWQQSNAYNDPLLFVIPKACDFFDLCVFGALYQMCFKP